jgi:FG-GAP-like repeat
MASSGASGSSTFKLAVDGAMVSTQTVTATTAAWVWNTTTVTNGARTLTLTVTDAAARTATTTLTVTVTNALGHRAVNDFDGDGRADLAVYRPTTAEWFIYSSTSGFRTLVFGAPSASSLGDTPVSADYDGDGKTDLAIYRKATGEWFIFGSASGFSTLVFGAAASSGSPTPRYPPTSTATARRTSSFTGPRPVSGWRSDPGTDKRGPPPGVRPRTYHYLDQPRRANSRATLLALHLVQLSSCHGAG